MTQERKGAAAVVTQEGTQLRVRHGAQELSARMVGFPESFRLRPGELVILADEPSGLVARPLVRAVRARAPRKAMEKDRRLEVEGRAFVLQDSTVVDSEPGEGGSPEEGTLWVVESRDVEGPAQVIAARWPRG